MKLAILGSEKDSWGINFNGDRTKYSGIKNTGCLKFGMNIVEGISNRIDR